MLPSAIWLIALIVLIVGEVLGPETWTRPGAELEIVS